MQKHPDADAFVLEHLRRPANATTRLAFADWLDETGTRANAAWASYIRLREEAERRTGPERRELIRSADDHAPKVRARLTLAARVFAGDPDAVLQLIPAANIRVRFAEFETPRAVLDMLPESMARENLVLPLALGGSTLFCVPAAPLAPDSLWRLKFILNKDVILVTPAGPDVQDAINRQYGQTETETVDYMLAEFPDTPVFESRADPVTAGPVVRFVNLLLAGATGRRADALRLDPQAGGLVVRERVGGVWSERDNIPSHLAGQVVMRVADMADIPANLAFAPPLTAYPLTGSFDFSVPSARFRAFVTVHPSPDGPTTELALAEAPA